MSLSQLTLNCVSEGLDVPQENTNHERILLI